MYKYIYVCACAFKGSNLAASILSICGTHCLLKGIIFQAAKLPIAIPIKKLAQKPESFWHFLRCLEFEQSCQLLVFTQQRFTRPIGWDLWILDDLGTFQTSIALERAWWHGHFDVLWVFALWPCPQKKRSFPRQGADFQCCFHLRLLETAELILLTNFDPWQWQHLTFTWRCYNHLAHFEWLVLYTKLALNFLERLSADPSSQRHHSASSPMPKPPSCCLLSALFTEIEDHHQQMSAHLKDVIPGPLPKCRPCWKFLSRSFERGYTIPWAMSRMP